MTNASRVRAKSATYFCRWSRYWRLPASPLRLALAWMLPALLPAAAAPAAPQSAMVDFRQDVRPVLERRCVVCHGCYDAPCQFKLQDEAGLRRGGTKQAVYDGTRLTEAQPTRLHEDAHSISAWRERGFHGVLGAADGDPAGGLLARMLDLRLRHPLPQASVLPRSFDFSRDREEWCPAPEEFDEFVEEHPLWSMPFGLPDLPAQEYAVLNTWLEAGAPPAAMAPLAPGLAASVSAWEAFFNSDAPRERLVARYLYEHLFLAHLYFEDAGSETVFFKLVRSRTPPGEPIDTIATRRPYEDPGTPRVWYRLWRDPESVVDKTHLPYALTAARRADWQAWFLDGAWNIDELPGYEPEVAGNPFVAFQAIPKAARHRFLLDEARFTIMNFIKGPVCRGRVALNVIQDRFWVFFTAPDFLDGTSYERFLIEESEHLRLPGEAGVGPWSIAHWVAYAHLQSEYLQAKIAFIAAQHEAFEQTRIGVIWDGEGANPNAALTVFRHHDSATVVPGLVGWLPKTAWVIDYPILERIHYLLVAGFDVFGSAAHQAMTRLYMDFLRMESELNFLAFLPPTTRRTEIAWWYRDAVEEVRNYMDVYFSEHVIDPLFDYRTEDHKRELLDAFATRLAPALGSNAYGLESANLPVAATSALERLGGVTAIAASLMPETVFVNIRGYGVVTILAERAYTNIASMFRDEDRRVPQEDSLTVVNGLLGAYPNVFLELDIDDLPTLVESISRMRSEADYRRLLDRFGVRRTSPRFWSLSDEIHALQGRTRPLEAGLLDYNRLENR